MEDDKKLYKSFLNGEQKSFEFMDLLKELMLQKI